VFTKKIVQPPKMHNKGTNASLKNLHWHFCVTVFTVGISFLATDSYETGKQ